MLTGEYRHSVDAKNRLFIPAKHREELGSSLMIVKDMYGKRLKVFSEEGWKRYIADILDEKQDMSRREKTEEVKRRLHRDAVYAEPDAQGRVVLTPALLKYAGITKEAVIIGCYDCAEIWAADLYDQDNDNEDMGLLVQQLKDLGL